MNQQFDYSLKESYINGRYWEDKKKDIVNWR
jgi:hypothetical protein